MLTGAAVDSNNALAAAESVGSSGSGDNSDSQPINVVRRYVPRFVGKREDAPLETLVESNNKHAFDDINETGELDDAVSKFVQYISSMGYKDSELEGLKEGNEESDIENENDNAMDEFEDLGYSVDDADEDSFLDSQEEKRFQPTFVGKRQYKPTFVGKRYQPMFVGKRYQPMFVGKRYQPMFVGKRYQPMFVGKRYQPMFVGKRYQPMFVGKRYQPMFVGKRYQPTFVGKRFTPTFVGKRDVSEINTNGEQVKNVRRKRSLSDDSDMLKRAWGRYTPLSRYAAFKRYPEPTAYKRFVAPEFIGRRDSLSSILSALDALQYIQQPGRSTSKRFEAPMFIGKRPFTPTFVGKRAPLRPMFVGKRTSLLSDINSLDALNEYALEEQQALGMSPLEYSSTHQGFSDESL